MGADQVLRLARFSLRVPGGAWSDAEVLGHHVFVSDAFMPASSLGLHCCVSLPVPPIHLELYLKCTHLLCTTYSSAGERSGCSLRGSRKEALPSPLNVFLMPTFYLYWPSALLHPLSPHLQPFGLDSWVTLQGASVWWRDGGEREVERFVLYEERRSWRREGDEEQPDVSSLLRPSEAMVRF